MSRFLGIYESLKPMVRSVSDWLEEQTTPPPLLIESRPFFFCTEIFPLGNLYRGVLMTYHPDSPEIEKLLEASYKESGREVERVEALQPDYLKGVTDEWSLIVKPGPVTVFGGLFVKAELVNAGIPIYISKRADWSSEGGFLEPFK